MFNKKGKIAIPPTVETRGFPREINMNIELTKTEYKLLTEILETYIQNNESGMVDGIFDTKSDKVYKLIDKIKN